MDKVEYSMFICSCDTYSDAWQPFFKLLDKYWGFKEDIYLATETKSYPGVIALNEESLYWSDRIIKALERVEGEYIFLMLEDYFLKHPVDTKEVQRMFEIFVDKDIDCMHISRYCSFGPFHNEGDIWEILPSKKKFMYRMSLQPAFWKVSSLIKCLKPRTSVWQFELEPVQAGKVYCRSLLQHNILDYVYSGIMRGKWNKEVVDLFKENNIEINYSERGMYEINSIL